MSRARHCTTVHVVADDLDEAVEDLRRDWSAERRSRWAIDTGTPAAEHGDPPFATRAVRRAALQGECDALVAIVPPDPSTEFRHVDRALAEMRSERTALADAAIRWWFHAELQQPADGLRTATAQRVQAEQILAGGELGWRSRRHWRAELAARQPQEADARHDYDRAVQPQRDAPDSEIADAEQRLDELEFVRFERDTWLKHHPDALVRLGRIELELDRLDSVGRVSPQIVRSPERTIEPPTPAPELAAELDVGLDLGL